MLKRLGLPLLGLGAMLAFVTPHAAKAAVQVGVYLGAPAYAYPAPVDPYAYPYSYSYPNGYYGPTYVAPNWGHERQQRGDRDDRGFYNRGQSFRGGDHGRGHERGRDRSDRH